MTATICARCGTELPPHALACPACKSLIHAEQLKQLANDAERATAAGDFFAARDHWSSALALLPVNAQQHTVVSQRVTDLTSRIDTARGSELQPAREGSDNTWWKRAAGAAVMIAVLLLGKAKFLLLGLTKMSTFTSMFAFFGVYWSLYGWPLALGLVVSIYIHEMGHVAMLRRLGIDAGAPLFIPGVGALVMLKQHITDPLTDARIGLAGPIWGLGAAIAASVVYYATGAGIWLAIAQLTAFLNLFNLIPIWQLDGSRGVHVLAAWERWALVSAIALALLMSGQRLLFIVAAVAVWRALQREAGPGNPRILATFIALVFALSFLARSVG